MAYDFPAAPILGQPFTPVSGGPAYAWDGTAWRMTSGGISAGVFIGDAPPANPVPGQLWWESDSGNTFIYFSDGSSSQWVQFNVAGDAEIDHLSSISADMSIGFRTSGNRFVVNDKADLSGTDVFQVSETGNMTVANTVNCGRVTGAGAISINTTGASFIYLRPNGEGLVTGQTTIDSAGAMTVAAAIYIGAPASTTGAVNGVSHHPGFSYTSRNVGTTASHHQFYNTNGLVGSIQTNASATSYATSSDERLKTVGADYDPAEAIAIIRADPVKNFQWKAGNVDAVGWIAQRSYAVHEDLATRIAPTEAGEKGEPAQEEFWGIDYGRRTPYLWAALTAALDRIDALEARVAELEAA